MWRRPATTDDDAVSSIFPAGYDPQASLDAALFASNGEALPPSDPAVAALETIGGSYGDEIAFLEQQLEPSTGAYGATGALAGGSSDPASQLEGALSSLLGGGASSSPIGAFPTGTDASLSADEQLLHDALPALPYGESGSLFGGAGPSLVDLLG